MRVSTGQRRSHACRDRSWVLPAFGPPTWALLVLFNLNYDLPAVPLILLGALAAAGGRLVLALGARHFRGRFSPERRENLAAAEQLLVGSRGRAAAGLGLFALSPVPSAQLFVAAGLLTVPLLPLTAAFLAGRLASYSIYVSAAAAAEESIGAVLGDVIGSPLGITLQLVMLGGPRPGERSRVRRLSGPAPMRGRTALRAP